MCNTYKLSIMMNYCKSHPHHVKEIIDSSNGDFKIIPLAGADGDTEVLPALSTFLLVIVILFIQWTRKDGVPSIQCIIVVPMLMDIGPAAIDLAAQKILCPRYDVQQIPVILK